MFESSNYLTNIKDEYTWKVGIYVRLSREDEKESKYKNQSESIENQIKFLKDVISKTKWNLIDIYSDDGYTGTNFNRPAFQKMIKDIEKGIINLVITKDLSRLGRDYIETGRFIEKYFPEKRVRYIAVNDNIDTFDLNNFSSDITPFKAVFNDMYAKDISSKVRTAITTKATAGECIKPFLPYGLKKDIHNKNNILIDEEVADNVRKIFNLYMQGNSKTEIAKKLNKWGIKTPLQHKQDTTNYYNPNAKQNYIYTWNSTMINKILRDRSYVGDLVQLKYKKINYKIQKLEKVSPDKQIIKENNYPAIIDRTIYNTVQEMLDKQTNEWNYSSRKRHILTGLVYCKCGGKITYNKNHSKYFRCICSNYKKYGKNFCKGVHIREDELIEIVTKSLKNNIQQYLIIENLQFHSINNKENNNVANIQNKKREINKLISKLYEDKISNVISQDTFLNLINKYENQKRQLDLEIKSYQMINNINDIDSKKIIENILKFNELNDKNVSLVFKLIDNIVIDDRKVNINYRFDISA